MSAAPRDSFTPLTDPGGLDPLMERIGDARVVCIGEASHGTHEFYAWRAALTRRLVGERGFDLVAVEGDWPDCHHVSRCVTGEPGAPEDPSDVLHDFDRWPTWMWANHEVLDFARWLRAHNLEKPPTDRTGFYGLDVYSLWESLDAVLGYLRQHHPEHVAPAVEASRCFEPYAEDPQAYAHATRIVPSGCEPEVVHMLADLLARHVVPRTDDSGPDGAFAAEQNARAVVGAEAYYRAMVRGGPDSWNIRDTHMADTLDRLVEHYEQARGRRARAVVWEHNTHVGDARFTDMTKAGMVNVGQLVRDQYGEDDTVLVGLGGHRGSVVAAAGWGEPTEVMDVPPARHGSTEDLLHEALADETGAPGVAVFPAELPDWAAEERAHRAIGVVYHPDAERWGNYVSTVLGRRYDAFLWFDETTALRPLRGVRARGGEQETWPYSA